MTMKSPRVLVTDDNKMARALISYYLKDLGCQVQEAENGEQSLQVMTKHPVDLLVLDWNMPVMNGYQTLMKGEEMVKSEPERIIRLPVLIYTNQKLQDLTLPRLNFFTVRATLSKKLTPFQQLMRVKTALEKITM
jgi:CheY-like chemotaxis protein